MPTYGPERDYGEWAHQTQEWPREGALIAPMPIEQMPPAHAINAYRKFCSWFQDNHSRFDVNSPEEAARTPLARALLAQAVGRPVVYVDDLPTMPVEPSNLGALDVVGARLSLEMVYDAVVETENIDHPVTRARVILSTIKNQQN